MEVDFQHSLARHPRYALPQEVIVMARPYGMKFYNFELRCQDVSRSGMKLVAVGAGFVPFQVANRLNCTFDFSGKTFGRPLHMVLEVRQVGLTTSGKQFFGCQRVSIDANHLAIFENMLLQLAEIT